MSAPQSRLRSRSRKLSAVPPRSRLAAKLGSAGKANCSDLSMKAAEIVREALQDCPDGPVTAACRPPCRAAGRIVLLAAARQNARLRARHGVPSWASSSSQIIAAGDEEACEARAPAYLKLSDAFSPTAQSPRPARPPAVRVRADGYFSALRGELHSDFQSAKRHRAGRADAAGCGAVGEDPYAMASLGARRLLRPRRPLRNTGFFYG